MKRLLLLIFFTTLTFGYAQSINVTETDNLIISKIFNGDWQSADTLIDLEIQKDPNHPKYYFMKAYNAYYCRFIKRISLERDVSIRRVTHFCWEGIKIGEALLQTTEVKFYLGNCYAFLSRANIMSREYWTAYWNAGKSEDYYEDVLEEDPSVTDAYLNLGVMEYFPDAMLEGFQYFMAWLGGASGDRETGLDYIERVAQNGTLFKEEAKVALAFIYWIGEQDNEKSLAYFTELHNKYTNADFLAYFYNRMNFVALVLQKGTGFLTAEADSLKEKYNIDNPNLITAAGYALMEEHRMDEARIAFQSNIDQWPEAYTSYRSMSDYYLRLEDEAGAIKYLKQAVEVLPVDTNYAEPVKVRIKQFLIEGLEELGADTTNL